MSTEISSAEQLARTIAALATEAALSAWAWKLFGFGRRPRRGAFFHRFVRQDRLATETFLLRELTIAGIATAASVASRAGSIPSSRYAARALELLQGTDGIVRAYRFVSPAAFRAYFVAGIGQYLRVEADQHPGQFFGRANSLVPKSVTGAWLVGAARLFAEPFGTLDMVKRLTHERSSRVIADVDLSDQSLVLELQ